jgi:CRISPR-associated endonuclease/helicase Cas3
LFKSLFAYRTTPCRKLHNLARSVIVLDEAQTIPVELLSPALAALRELVLNYGCSIVLCTATQPALERRAEFEIGIEGIRPIIPDAAPLFHALRRVEVHSLGKVADGFWHFRFESCAADLAGAIFVGIFSSLVPSHCTARTEWHQ